MHYRKWSAIVAALAGALSCSDSSGPAAAPCPAETTSVDVTVTVGATVVFDWTPKCAVALVLVEEGASDTWLLSGSHGFTESATAENVFAPPITYGQSHAQAVESYGPEALVPGTTYELILWRILPSGSTATCQVRANDACLLAVKEFTR